MFILKIYFLPIFNAFLHMFARQKQDNFQFGEIVDDFLLVKPVRICSGVGLHASMTSLLPVLQKTGLFV